LLGRVPLAPVRPCRSRDGALAARNRPISAPSGADAQWSRNREFDTSVSHTNVPASNEQISNVSAFVADPAELWPPSFAEFSAYGKILCGSEWVLDKMPQCARHALERVLMSLTVDDIVGIVGILPTPATPDAERWDAVDTVALPEVEKMTRAAVGAGIEILMTTGTFGEAATLTWPETLALVDCVVQNSGRRPVFAGVTTLNTRDTISRAREVVKIGASGLFVGRPMWLPLDQQQILKYYQDLAAALPGVPLIIYDNPHAFKGKITTETYQQLALIPEVVASKHTVARVWKVTSSLANAACGCCPSKPIGFPLRKSIRSSRARVGRETSLAHRRRSRRWRERSPIEIGLPQKPFTMSATGRSKRSSPAVTSGSLWTTAFNSVTHVSNRRRDRSGSDATALRWSTRSLCQRRRRSRPPIRAARAQIRFGCSRSMIRADATEGRM